jgi:transcriptional regulator with XRE-family HTH domain
LQIAPELIVGRSLNLIDKSLGSRLRERRTSTGWSQQELAEKLEIDPRDISAYEKGAKRISADRLLQLSKVLGVPPVYFFGFDEDGRPVRRDGPYLALSDQGLRLHKAFAGVKSAALREAIVSFVIELAKNESRP